MFKNEWLVKENEYLKQQIEILRIERDEFKNKLFELIDSKPQAPVSVPTVAVEKKPPLHTLTKTSTSAKCSCGWSFKSEDEGELATAISTHHVSISVSHKKKNFQSFRQIQEDIAELEARKKEKNQ